MSLELINAVASIGTFVVIAASAIAALMQLRHMRGSNQIYALNEFRETLESAKFSDAQRFVSFELPKRFADPDERRKMTTLPFAGEYEMIGNVANLFEGLGAFVRMDIIDRDMALDIWAYVGLRNWNALLPLTTYLRHTLKVPQLWENFEYYAALSEAYIRAHPRGSYSADMPRMREDLSLLEASRDDRGGKDPLSA